MTAIAALQAVGLVKQFGKHEALSGVSLDVAAGECLAIVGLNGAGKTTLLRLLAGVLEPSGGTVHLRADVARDPMAVGLLLAENLTAEPAWTPREYLEFLRRLSRKDEARTRVRMDIDQTGLTTWLDTPIKDLSSGNKRKVELLRLCTQDPAVVLLDEPTRELDIPSKAVVWDMIRRWKHAGKAVVIASHDLSEIAEISDRVAILSHGTVVQYFSPSEVVARRGEIERLLA